MTGDLTLELQTRLQSLARRIVDAAHVAASVHLFDSHEEAMQHYGRRVMAGGAGRVPPGDDVGADARGRRTSFDAAVTDDAPAAIPDRAAGASRRPPRYSEAAD